MDIRHVVVLMLENRSFDCMLGRLYPKSAAFDGIDGSETNVWHKPDGTQQEFQAWTDPTLTARTVVIPDPDPGELFTDIQMQLRGLTGDGKTLNPSFTMGGFVDNYMRQPATTPAPDPRAVMHCFTPDQVPVISQLALAFGVSDRWHASAPCQTWPNRFFAHTGTAAGYVDNHTFLVPFPAESIFHRLQKAGRTWRVYFHDMPQSMLLGDIWLYALFHFRGFNQFLAD